MRRQQPFAIALFCALTVSFCAAQTAPTTPEVERPESLAARAAAAKAAGRTEVSFPAPGVAYPVVPTGLTHAISEFTVVVGTPRAEQTVIENDSALSTWYSIEINEVISNRACKMCALLTLDGLPKPLRPNSLLPVPAHSMLLIRRGGSTTVDGVKVSETENGVPSLTVGKKYVFVVDKSPKGIARLVLNDAGIFVVEEETQALTPIATTNHSATAAATAEKFPSLAELRQRAKSAN